MMTGQKKYLNLAIAGVVSFLATIAVTSKHAVSAEFPMLSRAYEELVGMLDETDRNAPIDYGAGPGKPRKAQVTNEKSQKSAAASMSEMSAGAIPTGAINANIIGAFGAPIAWPIIPVHVVLLPNGNVMSYGTNESGTHGGKLIYDVWSPALGTDASSHLVLPNTTGSDIFCGAQSLMSSGSVLFSGGDLIVKSVVGSAVNSTSVFSPTANTLTANTAMTYARWYGSLVSLSDGRLAIFGGRENVGALAPTQQVTTPEIYDPTSQTWSLLTGATSTAAFGGVEWWYPKAQAAPGGNVVVLAVNGSLFSVSTANVGSIKKLATSASQTFHSLPLVQFAPGKLLSVGSRNQSAEVIDINQTVPVVTPTGSLDQLRLWSNGTVLADGTVLVTGGSTVANELTGVAYSVQIWNPITGLWTTGASATKPRLYHSTALLLPDGSVLTGGGGAPGPVANLNAEIYYPPYLYTSNGTPAVRPVISSAALNANTGALAMTVGTSDAISSVSFVRTGSATHSNNSDQRFISLAFSQIGQTVTATVPSDRTVVLPGYYMVFAFNTAGVPSVSQMINVE